MSRLWSPEQKVVQERRLWLAVLKAQQQLGLEISQEIIDAYAAVVEDVDLRSISAREEVSRHDVKARIDEFCALAGHERVHLGMTSRDLTENVEQLQILDSLRVIRDDLVALIARLADLADRHKSTVVVARTHNVAAQATTLGKRFADAASESLLSYERLSDLIERYPLRGIKGAVGTRLDQMDLLGSPQAAEELDQLIAEGLGFKNLLMTCGQVYPRSLDLDVIAALVQVVSPATSLATTLRLMAGHDLVSEGFQAGQVGSSAMPHKVNARSCERIAALRCVLDGHLAMAASLCGRQWSEGDVSCSATRRVLLPDAFFAADGLLHTAAAVLDELNVDTDAIASELQRFLPVLATSRMLTVLVNSGMGREAAHAVLAEPSRAAAQAAHGGDSVNLEDLLDEIAAHPSASLNRSELAKVVSSAASFTGAAQTQTERVVEAARAIVATHQEAATQRAQMRV